MFEVWGEGTTLGVAEAVFPGHGRPIGGGGSGRSGVRGENRILVFGLTLRDDFETGPGGRSSQLNVNPRSVLRSGTAHGGYESPK